MIVEYVLTMSSKARKNFAANNQKTDQWLNRRIKLLTSEACLFQWIQYDESFWPLFPEDLNDLLQYLKDNFMHQFSLFKVNNNSVARVGEYNPFNVKAVETTILTFDA